MLSGFSLVGGRILGRFLVIHRILRSEEHIQAFAGLDRSPKAISRAGKILHGVGNVAQFEVRDGRWRQVERHQQRAHIHAHAQLVSQAFRDGRATGASGGRDKRHHPRADNCSSGARKISLLHRRSGSRLGAFGHDRGISGLGDLAPIHRGNVDAAHHGSFLEYAAHIPDSRRQAPGWPRRARPGSPPAPGSAHPDRGQSPPAPQPGQGASGQALLEVAPLGGMCADHEAAVGEKRRLHLVEDRFVSGSGQHHGYLLLGDRHVIHGFTCLHDLHSWHRTDPPG